MNQFNKYLLPGFAFIMGVIALIVGIYTNATKDRFDMTVTATVVDVQEELNTAAADEDVGRYEIKAYITYEVNGVKYENVESPYNNDDVKIGDKADILVQSQNPTKYAAVDNAKSGKYFIIIGAVVAAFGLGGTVITFIKRR